MDLTRYMKLSVAEAEQSLREGNHGFGAVVVKDGEVIARAHDTEETDRDPTAHAEIKALRQAAAALGRDLTGCVLLATHEPCPMCAAAMVWANISRLAYGVGIAAAIAQGRRRIDLGCRELFRRAGAGIRVEPGVLERECAPLYHREVREEIRKLRNASPDELRALDAERARKRVQWVRSRPAEAEPPGDEAPYRAYRLLLERLGAAPAECPVIHRDGKKIVFHSANFCPTLEACRILYLDTRTVCRLYNEAAPDALVKAVDPALRFSRSYEKIRPYADCCEEQIEYAD